MFNTDKNKLEKLWNIVDDNSNIIITQKNTNDLIIDGVNKLNNVNTSMAVLTNFGTDWFIPNVLETTEDSETIIDGNYTEFKLTFNDIDATFIPYIHCEILYRAGESGFIPMVDDPSDGNKELPFDEVLGLSNRLVTNEIFQITDSSVEYIAFIRMDFNTVDPQEIEYKIVCYIQNPHYYRAT
jgi:hypothetical protein